MRISTWLVTTLLLIAQGVSALDPFEASYTSKYGVLSASGSRSLEPGEEGTWLLQHNARLLLVTVAEQSRFRIDKGVVVPLDYAFTNPLSSNRSQSLHFDWERQEVTELNRDSRLALTPRLYDRLSYQVQVKLDICADPAAFQSADYQFVDRDRVKSYRVSRVKEEVLTTDVGPLRTLRLRQVRADKQDDEPTYMWVAIDWQCLLVRLEQQEDGKVLSLRLKSARVGNQPVHGIQ
ncbi:MAG: DUF3108 domain-containing protein [Spongiibacteraceae bacterium]|jgi:hypothetical protein|nr:DUF3108 domain-containing protein [Spongiibacteraceae bacterium]